MTYDEFIIFLEQRGLAPRKTGAGWIARCPVCDAAAAYPEHLSVAVGDEERILLKCHHGCDTEDVVAALDLRMADLFHADCRAKPRENVAVVESRAVARHLVDTYRYVDEASVLLFEVQRFERTDAKGKRHKDFPQRRPNPDAPGQYINNLDGVRRVIYRLPEVIAAIGNHRVVVVEGEKDADNGATKLGLVTTCNPGGAGNWTPEYNESLRGADVLVIADRDPDEKNGQPHRKGQLHAAAVAGHLAGVARNVMVLELPDRDGHRVKDLSDWIAVGGTLEDFKAVAKQHAVPGAKYVGGTERVGGHSVGCVGSVGGPREWSAPIPFSEHPRPSFPADTLPAWAREYVEALAVSVQVPTDLLAFFVLGALATSAAGKVEVQVKAGYVEPVNLFLCCPMDSANRKTAALNKAYGPVYGVQAEFVRAAVADMAAANTKRDLLLDRLNVAKKKAARVADATERAQAESDAIRLADDLARIEVPVEPRLVVDDVTPEKLSAMMAEQHGRIALASAEGGIFDILAGRYSNGVPNLDVFLKGHAGDPLSIDRLGRPSVVVPMPALTLVLSPQPTVVAKLADVPGFRGRGLIARFLFSIPRSLVGHRDVDPPCVPESVEAEYESRLGALLRLPVPTAPHLLTLHHDARACWLDFARWVEPQLGEGAALAPIADWGGKLPGAVARIAGLLYSGDRAGEADPWRDPLSADVMERAIRIGHSLIHHAHAAFALMGADPLVDHAKHALRWIQRNGIKTFTTREVHKALEHRLPRVADLEPVLALLAERAFVRRAAVDPVRRPGRPKSDAWEVNPTAADNTDETDTTQVGASVDGGSVGSVGEVPTASSEDAASLAPETDIAGTVAEAPLDEAIVVASATPPEPTPSAASDEPWEEWHEP